MSYEETVAKSRARFVRETAEHQLGVLRDDGLYRHLRFQQPGSPFYWFDLVTWPGRLVVCGDAGNFMFARLRDMFEFFAPRGARGGFEDARWGINPDYWSQKLEAPDGRAVRVYSEQALRERVLAWHAEASEELLPHEVTSLRWALERQVLKDDGYTILDEHEARRRLHAFEHDGRRIYDPSDWDLCEYDWQFLWCCWAIVWGIGQYRAATREPVAA